MDRSNPYYRQVQLLVQLLPLVARERCFALKGGTAINLYQKPSTGLCRGISRHDTDRNALPELEDARTQLLESITSSLTDDEKHFLCSVYALEPDATLLGLDGVMDLPAVRWKLQNIERMPPSKRAACLRTLQQVLNIEP